MNDVSEAPRRTVLDSCWVSSLALTLVAAIAVGAGLGQRELWNPLEPRYVGIALEMETSANWLVPRYEGAWYAQKPPLVFWLSALAHALAPKGWELFALRLPSACGAWFAALAVLFLGRRWFGPRAALVAGCAFLTSWMPFLSARFLHLDTFVAAASTWAMAALFAAADAANSRERRVALVLASLALGVGLLVKGPPVLVGPAITVAAYALWHRDVRWIVRSGILPSTLAAVILAGAWLLPAVSRAGWEFAKELVLGQAVGRHLESTGDRNGPHFYVLGVLGALAPWSLFLPAALLEAWRRRQGPERRPLLICTLWLGLGLLVLTLAPMRRSRYLLPLLPAAALLVGWWWDRAALRCGPGTTARRFTVVGVTLLGCATTAIGAALLGRAALARLGSDLAHAARSLPDSATSFGIVALALGAAMLGSLRHPSRALTYAIAALLHLALTFAFVLAPAVDAHRGDRELIAFLRSRRDRATATVAIAGPYAGRESTEGWFAFYLGRPPRTFRTLGPEVERLADDPEVRLVVRALDIERGFQLPSSRWSRATPVPLGHHGLLIFEPASIR